MNIKTVCEMARHHVLGDLTAWGDFVAGASELREGSPFFGNISTADLLRFANGVPLHDAILPTEAQRIAARDEAIVRFLSFKNDAVLAQIEALSREVETI